MRPFVSQLMVYPVKSFAGIQVNQVDVNPRGLGFDRRWMLVDERGEMLTQRTIPELSQIGTRINDDRLSLVLEGKTVDVPRPGDTRIEAKVWSDAGAAHLIEGNISKLLSEYLHMPVNLVWMSEDFHRAVESRPGTENKIVGFADGYPFLIASEASLEELNRRLEQPVSMNRFRPNIVVSNTAAFEEDAWKRYVIGPITFANVKPCARCVMTTVDPETSAKGKEPLKTLSRFRRRDGEVFFGQNAVHVGEGVLTVGDSVKVLERVSMDT